MSTADRLALRLPLRLAQGTLRANGQRGKKLSKIRLYRALRQAQDRLRRRSGAAEVRTVLGPVPTDHMESV
jgi:hypothetical protein